MIDFQEFSEKILKTSDEDELFELVQQQIQQYGYDNIVVSTYDPIEGPRILQAILPEGWVETYFDQQFWNVDPAYKAQASLWQPHTWDSIAPRTPERRTQEFIGISHECGLKHGLTASTSMMGKKVNFAISARENLDKDFEEKMLGPNFLVASAYAARLATFYNEKPGMLLTIRERELIQWIVGGLTNADIATKMGISPKTVDEYIRRISERNGVRGRVQIAVTSILTGQVNL